MARRPLAVAEPMSGGFSLQGHGHLSPDSELNLLVFRVGPCTFCVPAMDVDEIITSPDITSLPFTSRPVIGIFPHRTGIISAYCLHEKLGLGEIEDRTDGRLIVSTIDETRVAYWIHSVEDIVTTSEVKFVEPNTSPCMMTVFFFTPVWNVCTVCPYCRRHTVYMRVLHGTDRHRSGQNHRQSVV